MKKVLALGAVAVVLGLSCGFEMAPAMAVSATTDTVAVSACELVAAAVARAEEAIAATTGATTNATEVAAMQAYLRKWVAQARTVDVAQLSAGQLKELIAALDEGARGLRMTAGVDRKVSTGMAGSTTSGSASGAAASSSTVNATIAEPRTAKTSGSATDTAGVSELSEVKTVTPVAKTAEASVGSTTSGASTVKAEVATTSTTKVESKVASPLEVAEMNAMATLATAQMRKTVAVAPTGLAVMPDENAEVEVPKTGASDEEEQTSTAVRGMGLVLGGAVVLAAAAGAVLIVKRMKRGL